MFMERTSRVEEHEKNPKAKLRGGPQASDHAQLCENFLLPPHKMFKLVLNASNRNDEIKECTLELNKTDVHLLTHLLISDFPTTSFLTNKPIQKRQLDGGGPASALTQIPSQLQNFGQLQQGFSTLMNTMKDGKMVMGGFSFVIVPAPDMEQLQGLPTLGGLPSIPSLPGAGGS